MDGVVIDSGPASGFGLWVRVQHGDGTFTVYGHINETLVDVSQRVAAGETARPWSG
ncbi:MAG: M23 family metallopeptidase [Geodermatophilaceae bacterium]